MLFNQNADCRSDSIRKSSRFRGRFKASEICTGIIGSAFNRRLPAGTLSLSPVRRLELEVEGDRVADLHGRGLKETKFNLTGTEACGYVVKFGLYPQLAKMRIGTEGRRFENHDELRNLSLKLLHSQLKILNGR